MSIQVIKSFSSITDVVELVDIIVSADRNDFIERKKKIGVPRQNT